MSQDLKLGGDADMVLTSASSNVAQNFTLKAQNTGAWCTDSNESCVNQSLVIKTGVPNGYLYNWHTATAGAGKYETVSNNVGSSICPRGWKLPTGIVGGDFANVDIAYGGSGENRFNDVTQANKFLASPLSYNYTGYRFGDSIIYATTIARYWSSSALNVSSAQGLEFTDSGYLRPQDNNGKQTGSAVRCMATI